MADQYDVWWVRNGWAIVIGQTAYYSSAKWEVNDAWRAHEDCHKRQWAEYGWFKFPVLYLYYTLRYGYTANPFEFEARNDAAKVKGVG